ncbi:LiaF transmembrane domain-containing protein [Paludibacterium paludis]|uniref:LiaF transmembrane domain-containing protein n=1 Tax=Paludibacterium paludis TaxID=1225769 RepID=A0A918NYR5_9NEIS|nr:hypothetical protein [Paludibacterium paludis]GGY07816.1 hypothetical protein GCM10011289_07950 [Paludibacterium paludis]
MRHHCHSPNRQQRRIVFGLFFILAGSLALLDSLRIIAIGNLADYWPSVFCLIGVLQIMQSGSFPGRLTGLAFTVLGGGLILQNLGVIQHAMGLILPLLLIIAGIAIVARAFRGHAPRPAPSADTDIHEEKDGFIHVNAAMSSNVVRCDAQAFAGGELHSVMGSIELDLSQASMPSQAALHVFAVCSGIQIRIPRDWQIQIRISPVLGGVEDKTIPPASSSKILTLEGGVIMGGIQINH